jgi:diacylglycerol kinase (ATP)
VAHTCPISSLLPAVVFVNSAAGGFRARNRLHRLRALFETASIATEFVYTESSQELESSVLAAIKEGKRLLLSFGGDGTLQALVNAAYGSNVVVGVLPAGGGNDFAASLHLPKNPVDAAAALLKAAPRCVDLVRARTGDGRERLYLGGGGLGIDAEAARHANSTFRNLPGRSRYIASALRALWGFRPIQVRAEFPGSDLSPVEAKCLVSAVLNTPTYGAGIRLAPDAAIDDGWLDIVFVQDLDFLDVLRVLPRLMRTGELHPRYVKRMRAQKVRIITDRPCLFHGDGEILGPAPVEIEIIPRAIKVLAPMLGKGPDFATEP